MMAIQFMIGLILLATASAEFRLWTDSDGRAAELELVRVLESDDGKVGEFRMRNGRMVKIQPSALSEEDALALDEWRPAVLVAPEKDANRKKGRPRIFMAMHGLNALAEDDLLDDQWTYVRENIDGIHNNAAHINIDLQAKIWRKVKTRNVTAELHPNGKLPKPAGDSILHPKYPDIKLKRQEAIYYTNKPNEDWELYDLDEFQKAFKKSGYTNWWFGMQPGNFERGLTGKALEAYHRSGGAMMELPRSLALKRYYKEMSTAMKDAHAKGGGFMWFNSNVRGEPWLESFQNTYTKYKKEGRWTENDIVMLINYQGRMPLVPEVDEKGNPADTFTGLLYWALHQ
jgi:hypothetical protein